MDSLPSLPNEIPFDRFNIVLATPESGGGLYFCPRGYGVGGYVRIGEAAFAYPDYRRGGCWLKWASGECFIPCDLFDKAGRIAERLLQAGLKFDIAHKAKIRNYVTAAYGQETAVTPHDLDWPDRALHEVEGADGGEAGHGD